VIKAAYTQGYGMVPSRSGELAQQRQQVNPHNAVGRELKKDTSKYRHHTTADSQNTPVRVFKNPAKLL